MKANNSSCRNQHYQSVDCANLPSTISWSKF